MTSRILVLLVGSLLPLALQAQPGDSPPPCTEPQQKQFDFWIGEWDLTWPGEHAVEHGSNSVKRELDGCVIEENFSGGDAMHLRGKSVSSFDSRSGKWKQTWVDNEGGYLDFSGEFRESQMILERQGIRPDGGRVLQRMIFKNISTNAFDWSWEASGDGGKTWQVKWPIHYQRRP
jgi:hypothetical protein